jgi:hypothetical protein
MTNYPWYIQIADAIQEKKTFDMQLDEGGWSTIHWLIANHMLSEFSPASQYQMLGPYVGKIKHNLNMAIDYLNSERSVPVYKLIATGDNENKKNIDCITIDPGYRDARIANYERIKKRVNSGLFSFMKQLEYTCPEKLPGLSGGQETFTRLIENA